MPLKAKARLCLAGHLCPDAVSGELQVDSPTIDRISTMIFLHSVISMGWIKNWFIGDISNAFLQGADLVGKVMYMRQPRQGLPNLMPGQLLKLRKAVYGRPDAPRKWFEELARILESEFSFTKSAIDPAMFYLNSKQGVLCDLLIVHVDDLMIAVDGSDYANSVVKNLKQRFPFGTWQCVCQEIGGVSYCGKEIKIGQDQDGEFISLGQDGFIDGRLENIPLDKQRAKQLDERANPEELSNYRSAVGSLQWLAGQSRPDISFEVNQLQKRTRDLRIFDIHRANRCIKEVRNNRHQMKFRNLGEQTEVVVFHDAALFNSVGVEIEEQEADDILQKGTERKLVYSQKGVVTGLVRKGETDSSRDKIQMNILDWKSTTNRRVIESSLAAETHAAILGQGLGRFAQTLLAEAKYGPELITAFDDSDWQSIVPMHLITDCRSIYDHVNKDGQHVSDKGISSRLFC